MNLYQSAHDYNQLYPGFGTYSGLPVDADLKNAMGDCIRLAASVPPAVDPVSEQVCLREVLGEVNKLAPTSAGFFLHHVVENPQVRGTARALEFMLAAMRERSPETFEHVKNHTGLAMHFYEQRYGAPRSSEEAATLLTMMMGAMGHDIGKEGLDPHLLHQSTRIPAARMDVMLTNYATRVPDYPEKAHDLAFLKQANEGRLMFATAEELQTTQGPMPNQIAAEGWNRSEAYTTSTAQRCEHNALFARMDARAQHYIPAQEWLLPEEKSRVTGAYRGTLTPLESQIVNSHDKMSEAFFQQLELPPFLMGVKDIVSMDRFRPQAKTTVAPSELAEMIHLTDVFEALTANRSYRGALPVDTALTIMQGMANAKQINGALLQDFIARGTAQDFAGVTGRTLEAAAPVAAQQGSWVSRPGIVSRAPQQDAPRFAALLQANAAPNLPSFP